MKSRLITLGITLTLAATAIAPIASAGGFSKP
jgi:hypothetical protein